MGQLVLNTMTIVLTVDIHNVLRKLHNARIYHLGQLSCNTDPRCKYLKYFNKNKKEIIAGMGILSIKSRP